MNRVSAAKYDRDTTSQVLFFHGNDMPAWDGVGAFPLLHCVYQTRLFFSIANRTTQNHDDVKPICISDNTDGYPAKRVEAVVIMTRVT